MTVTLENNQSPTKHLPLSPIIHSLEDLQIQNVNNPIQEPAKDDDPTQKTPPITSFRFGLRPASKLKQALESLSDADFNQEGFGLIEVVENGLEITVRNSKTEVVGHLWLKSSGLIKFEFNKAMINKMINLNCILDNLVDASANDTVTLFHLHGSSQIYFMFGSDSPRQFSVDLVEMDGSFEKFPNITYVCEAVVLSDHFREIIQEYEALHKIPRIASLEISNRLLVIYVDQKQWPMYEKVNGIRGMPPNTMHNGWFQLHHLESLKKASFIGVGLLLCLIADPSEQIMLRFNLRELGDLVFISKAGYLGFDVNDSHYEAAGLRLLASAASLM